MQIQTKLLKEWADALKFVTDPAGNVASVLTAIEAIVGKEDANRTIHIPVHNIVMTIEKGHGKIESDLKQATNASGLNMAFTGLEQLILAHALTGVDVDSAKYWAGIEDAVETLVNNYE